MDQLIEGRLKHWADDCRRRFDATAPRLERSRRDIETFARLLQDVLLPTMGEFGDLLRSEGFDYTIQQGRDATQAAYVRFHPMASRGTDHDDCPPCIAFAEQAETATMLVTITAEYGLSSVQEVAISDLDRFQVIRHLLVLAKETLMR